MGAALGAAGNVQREVENVGVFSGDRLGDVARGDAAGGAGRRAGARGDACARVGGRGDETGGGGGVLEGWLATAG